MLIDIPVYEMYYLVLFILFRGYVISPDLPGKVPAPYSDVLHGC